MSVNKIDKQSNTISSTLLYLTKELSKISEVPDIESEIILQSVLRITKKDLILNGNKRISASPYSQIVKALNKRKDNIPLEYILRSKFFYSSEFYVDRNVLIPRPETELLVEEVLKNLRLETNKNINLLEIGVGSGCIFISIAKELIKTKNISINFYLTDISPKALKIAKMNLKKIINIIPSNFEFNFYEADVIPQFPKNLKFDYVISNPPYIPTSDINGLDLEVKKEPVMALDGGQDGLDIYKDILTKINSYLYQNTQIFFEIHSPNAEKTANLVKELTNKKPQILKDLAGLERIIVAA